MDKVDQFRVLKEIFSLKSMKNQALADIDEEWKRVEKIKHKKRQKIDELTSANLEYKELKASSTLLENQLEKQNSLLEKKKEQKNQVTNETQLNSIENEIQALTEQVSFLEENVLIVLENLESMEAEIKEHEDFINGVDETIEEIANEVKDFENKKNKEVENFKKRFLSLKDQLTGDFQATFKRLNQKEFKTSTFTRLNDISCEFCGLSIERPQLKEIDINMSLVTCKGCGRLILPACV